MDFGVDYYPEHWPEFRWEQDISQMKELNFNIIRIAEFAWCRLEPEEGRYEFSWLDRVIDICGRYELNIMMGVPVRNVPVWLLEKDPSIAIQAFDGHRESFGSRYTICLNHPLVREYALNLSKKMADHYKNEERITSWHLDNEYGDASLCYCENCKANFIQWLKNKYQSIENINKAWGLVFWSLEIQDWNQIWLPSRTNHFRHNPGLLLDYQRFTSWTTEMFVKEQAQIFRDRTSQIITTNLQSMTRSHTDYFELSKYIDKVSVNYYPPISYNTVDLDIMRSLKKQNFWVVEQKSGAPGFAHPGFTSSGPGETRLYTYQSIAHGADAVLYFRWRPSYFGAEQYHLGIMNYDGSTNRIFEEIKKVGQELPVVWEQIKGTTVKNHVGMLMSYESRWALKSYYPHPEIEYRDYFLKFYKELERQHYTVDILHPKDDLSEYKIIFVPLLYVMDDEMAENLVNYVERGGTIIYTFRSGSKDADSNIVPNILPPKIQKLLGIEIKESIALAPGDQTEMILENGLSFPVSCWIDLVQPKKAQVLARYNKNWYQGEAAITVNQFGKGKAFYVGTYPGEEYYQEFIREIMEQAHVNPLINGSPDVQVCVRTDGNSKVMFLFNLSSEKQTVQLFDSCTSILTGKKMDGSMVIDPHDVAILKVNNPI